MGENPKQDQESIISSLRFTLRRKEKEASELKEALKSLLESHTRKKKKHAMRFSRLHKSYSKRLVEMEIDLETHDIHFTNYTREQMELERRAVLEVDDANKTDCDLDQLELISRLVADHAELEHRYKVNRAENMERIRELEYENQRLRRLNDLSNSPKRYGTAKNETQNDRPDAVELTTDTDLIESDSDHTRILRRLERGNILLAQSRNELRKRLQALENRGSSVSNLSVQSIAADVTNSSGMHLGEKERRVTEEKLLLLRAKAITYQTRNLWTSTYPTNSTDKARIPSPTDDQSCKIQELERILQLKDRELREEKKRRRRQELPIRN